MLDDLPYVFNPAWDLKNDYRTRSMLALPIRDARGDIIGVLQLINARDEAGATAAVSGAAPRAIRRPLAGGGPRRDRHPPAERPGPPPSLPGRAAPALRPHPPTGGGHGPR